MLHPIDDFAFERLLNGDVCHRDRWRGAMPVLFVRRKRNNIARPDFLYWSTLTLSPADAGGDDQRLTERMCMPGSARARLERDARATTRAGSGASING